ncbi:MAG: DUF2764 domain-containing protein [Candidatus Omnitrophica bacterium]|nr:DUF2764 domain-containing protein [Candidatus Omnitrophota bacterium]MCM8792874.1 DUF2764 domain-containing protein [Candidatus Omnitrophota bacterium]
MPRYYTYLISSLPYLQFDREPPFSFSSFLERCKDFISDKEIFLLKMAGEREPKLSEIKQPTLKSYFLFEIALRDELVKLRALRRKEEPEKYLRKSDYVLSLHLINSIIQAFKNPAILEAERNLDILRWNFLEELERGHYFDFDFLVVYAFKLLILERWEKVKRADKEAILEKLFK